MFGIAVTMEPYHLVNSPEFRDALPATDIPTAVASASELEDAVVANAPGLEEAILAQIEQPPPGGWSLRAPASGRTDINPILDEAWAAYPWGTEHTSPSGDTAAMEP
ncbi:hypothetical protein [Streptomyces sp. NPDC002671]